MFNLKYILLTISVAGLAIGFSGAQPDILSIGLPIGTVCLGLFLIVRVWEKESALYVEQAAAEAARRANLPNRTARGGNRFEEELTHPALTTAHSH